MFDYNSKIHHDTIVYKEPYMMRVSAYRIDINRQTYGLISFTRSKNHDRVITVDSGEMKKTPDEIRELFIREMECYYKQGWKDCFEFLHANDLGYYTGSHIVSAVPYGEPHTIEGLQDDEILGIDKGVKYILDTVSYEKQKNTYYYFVFNKYGERVKIEKDSKVVECRFDFTNLSFPSEVALTSID